MSSSRNALSAFKQLEADFNHQQINVDKQHLEKALFLSQLFLELDKYEKTYEKRGIFTTIANDAIAIIGEDHGSDYIKGDEFWRHVQLYLESGVRITQEFVEKINTDINELGIPQQPSAIFCFLHNELHFKDTNPFYNIFRYLECASKLKDSKDKYNRKVKTFNELLAIFNDSDNALWMENCKKLINDYKTDTLLFNRKGKFVDLLNALKNKTLDLDEIKISFNDFCEHVKQQTEVLTLAEKLTNLHPAQKNSLSL